MKTRFVLALALALVAACGSSRRSSSSDDDDETSGPGETDGSGGSGGGGEGAVCSSADFEAKVIAFCKAQNPPPPAPGEMGAACVDDTQCNSNVCLQPFSSNAYCSIQCPAGNECPVGWGCNDTGTGLGAACYNGVCIYGGTDATDCTANLIGEIETACSSQCTAARVQAWVDCIAGAGKLCGPEHAAETCGIERGLLESCCIGCNSNDW